MTLHGVCRFFKRTTFDSKNLGFQNDMFHPYGAVKYADFHAIMSTIPLQKNLDVFVDFGSGKGRAIVLAATYPFRRVVGIDLSKELCIVARANVRRAMPKLVCKDVQIVDCDATTYILPDDANILFFNNTFHGEILAQVMENIRQVIEARPRKLYVICNNPSSQSRFDTYMSTLPWLIRERDLPLAEPRHCVVYTTADAVEGHEKAKVAV